jgi:transcription antitermination factor NusG
MAKEVKNQTDMGSVVTDTLHKSSGSAVPGAQDLNFTLDPDADQTWFAAMLSHQKYTSFCCEYIQQAFRHQQCRCFVPSKEELHRYPNRTKRMVRKFIIPRMVFVTGLSEEQAYHFVREWPYVDIFLPDRAKKERAHRHVPLARISQRELVKLQRVIQGASSADDITFTTDHLTLDDEIEVAYGDLRGLSGNYFHDADSDYLVFALGRLGNVKVKVFKKDCILKPKK